MISFLIFYLLVGFSVAVWGTVLSKGKKIKPSTFDTLSTVFCWLPYLLIVLWWKATLSEAEKEHLHKLMNEDE